nr:hypothetical protein [Tanacetum cinerariifolium]
AFPLLVRKFPLPEGTSHYLKKNATARKKFCHCQKFALLSLSKRNLWRNRSDLDTMSLDDLYNHLKVYEAEVQKKSEPNTQNMAFISLKDINQINEDDIEEMDIKWNMALLSMRADKF